MSEDFRISQELGRLLAMAAVLAISWFALSTPILALVLGNGFLQSSFGRAWFITFFGVPFLYVFHWVAFLEMKGFAKWVARLLLIMLDILLAGMLLC